jgi:hypothetical protein
MVFMNERIRELAIQNGFIHNWMPPGEQHDKLNNLEKFAELIIREYSYDCMDVTSNSEHIQFVAKKWGVEL